MLLYNSRDRQYKTPFGAVPTDGEINIVFPISNNIVAQGVYLIVRKETGNMRYQLQYVSEQRGYNIFSVAFSLPNKGIYYYRFEIQTANGILFVGRNKNASAIIGDWLPEWQLTVYDKAYCPPSWLSGGIIYHIFPDRFARVDDGKKPAFGYLKSWEQDITIVDDDGVYRANDFFGGNIKGILSRLDYLASLSVSAIYFSPIFEAASNHRYDTGDYMKIDSLFGTEQEFATLCKECEKLGIGIILDGVFNHTGANSLYFNKFGNYPTIGAYQSKDSPYYDWFSFIEYPNKYHCWWGVTVVPSVKRNSAGFQNLIVGNNGVLDKWTKMGVKGWRLDVVDELSSEFVKKIREKIKSHGDIALIGEVWEDASTKVSYSEKREYLLGKELDGVMNYPYRIAILDYVKGGKGKKFKNSIMDIMENYPRWALDNSMTLIGSHDTVRAITELSGVHAPMTKKERKNYRMTADVYQKAVKKLKLSAVLQYMLPGIPTLYYGDEIGMQGYEDPINRRPMQKDDIDIDLLNFYKTLGNIRKDNKQSLLSDYTLKVVDNIVYIMCGKLTIIVNPSHQMHMLTSSCHDLLSQTTVTAVLPQTAVIFKRENNN